MIIRIFTILLPIYFLALNCFAQDQRAIDSLKAVIEEAALDTLVCDAYLSWGEEVYMSNPDTAVILFHKARETAETSLASGPSPALEKNRHSEPACRLRAAQRRIGKLRIKKIAHSTCLTGTQFASSSPPLDLIPFFESESNQVSPQGGLFDRVTIKQGAHEASTAKRQGELSNCHSNNQNIIYLLGSPLRLFLRDTQGSAWNTRLRLL